MKSESECQNILLQNINMHNNFFKCCMPVKCLLQTSINSCEENDIVKIICSNQDCQEGNYMHNYCFDQWQKRILHFFVTTTKIKNWSEKQKLQYIWTKKGYDIVYSICECKCSKGFLKPDEDNFFALDSGLEKGTYNKNYYDLYNNEYDHYNSSLNNKYRVRTISKSSKSSNSSLSINASPSPLSFFQTSLLVSDHPKLLASCGKPNNGHPYSTDNHIKVLPQEKYYNRLLNKNILENYTKSPELSGSNVNNQNDPSTNSELMDYKHSTNENDPLLGCIFPVRTDYTVFNCLPRSLINSYHIKMDDEGPHGNDEIRYTLLSHLSSLKITSLPCIYCCTQLSIYDRYPLIDGAMFLSPLNHSFNNSLLEMELGSNLSHCKEGIRFKMDQHNNHKDKEDCYKNLLPYLNAICMHCLTGTKIFNLLRELYIRITCNYDTNNGDKAKSVVNDHNLSSISKLNIIICKYCNKPWDGSNFTIGTLYFYDIMSATSCCNPRTSCNKCGTNLVHFSGTNSDPLLNKYNNERYMNQVLNDTLRSNDFNNPNNAMSKLSNLTTFNHTLNSPTGNAPPFYNYFSQYSQTCVCHNCNTIDYHFVKEKSYELIKISVPDNFINFN